jgi:transcriptional regulator with XRE-family HTH domain
MHRLTELRNIKNMSQKELSQKSGLSQSYIAMLEKGERNLNYKTMQQLAQALNINPQDLISNTPVNSDSISIKIIDAVACCGTGIEALHENIIGTWDIPLQKYRDFSTAKPENVYMLQVEGDSMSPTLNSGDWALADTSQNYISSDGLYLIRMASGLAVKRIQSGLNDITIKSDNPAYKDITASIGEVSIIGKIIYTLNAKKYG